MVTGDVAAHGSPNLSRRLALRRAWYAVTAAAGLAGAALYVAGEVLRLLDVEARGQAPTLADVLRLVAYDLTAFSFLTAVLIGLAGTALARRPGCPGLASRWLLLVALTSALVSAVLSRVLVAPTVWTGLFAGFDVLAHSVAPALLLLGWLALGPRPAFGPRLLALGLLWPLAFVAYRLLLGVATGVYPFPLPDPDVVGAAGLALVNAALLVLGSVAVSAFVGVDRVLPGGRPAPGRDGAQQE